MMGISLNIVYNQLLFSTICPLYILRRSIIMITNNFSYLDVA